MASWKSFVLAVLGAAWAIATSAQGLDPLDLGPLRIEHETRVLPNGLVLLVHEDHSLPIVSVNTWYHVGSRNESRGRTGFAHLFEHFFFNGSENYPHGFREAMDDLGANNRNGTTNGDRTNFFEDVPTSALERTLFLESDRMGFLAGRITPESLQRERGVVQNEKRQGENRPYGRVFTRVVESIYPYSHPYSWPTIGSMEDLEAATLEDVRTWYRTFYGPGNCVLSLAGDITVDRAVELVEKYFGAIPPGPPVPRYQRWVPRLEDDLRDVLEDRVPQARIYRVYHVPGWGSDASAHLQLVASVLSGSKSARLDRALIYEKRLATSVSADMEDLELSGLFSVTATVRPGVDTAEVEREMDAILDQFHRSGPTDEELRRARARIVASFVRGTERLGGFGGRSDVLAASMTYGGSPEAYLDTFRTMARAQSEEVLATSRDWLGRHHYTLTVVPYPELEGSGTDVDRSVLPALTERSKVPFPEVQSRQLENGLQLLLLERRGVPLVHLTLASDAGFAADSGEKMGLARMTLEMMEEGTDSRDGFKVVDDLDDLGAFVTTDNSLDLSFVRLRALKAGLGEALEIYADIVLSPAFPPEAFEIAKRRQLARIEQELAQPTAAALRLVPPLLFGAGHAYSSPLTGSGTLESVESLTRRDLADWHNAWLRPNNSTLIVAGDITMDELVRQVEPGFGRWQRAEVPKKNLSEMAPSKSRNVYLVDKPGAPQSVIVAAQLSLPGGQPEDLAMETVMRLFGGMATSRLNRNLRLDKHWSYGVYGALREARGPRPMIVIAPVQRDKTKESMLEVLAEIRGIAGERAIRGEELESIKRHMVLRLPGRFETLEDLEEAATTMVRYGYEPQYYYDYATNVERLSEGELNAAAAKFIQPDKLTWLVIGDLAEIEDDVVSLGFGEPVRLESGEVP